MKAYETIYLFKWLFPEEVVLKNSQKIQEMNTFGKKFKRVRELFGKKRVGGGDNNALLTKYLDLFDNIDNRLDEILKH